MVFYESRPTDRQADYNYRKSVCVRVDLNQIELLGWLNSRDRASSLCGLRLSRQIGYM